MQQTSEKSPACIATAVLVFVLGCLVSSVRLIWNAPLSQIHSTDDIAKRFDQRFAELKGLLPERGAVGYIGDSSDPIADYYLAQYALAPLVVEYSLNHPRIVGNFPSSQPTYLQHNLRVIRDFGNGVFLLAPKDDR